MPLSIVKGNSRTRFSEVLANLAFIESIEPRDAVEAPVHVKILRGLYYVHLYAALENAVNDTIEQVLLLIKNSSVQNRHYKTEFNAISLHSKMQGFKSASYREYFNRSSEIFRSVDSPDVFDINNTIFSMNLQNVSYDTLELLLRCFGIPALSLDRRIQFTIIEIVDKRNMVAHGRETPTAVGERYRCDVLRMKTQEVQHAVGAFIDSFEVYVRDCLYVKDQHRQEYQR